MARCEEYVSRYSVCVNCNNEAVDCGKEKCPVYKAPAADVMPRAEVAREIFEEIEELRLKHTYGEIDEADLNIGLYMLKKKYTGGQNNQ